MCGEVRYAMKVEPMIVHACHCTDCQRITGTAFVLNAWIECANVELLSGAPASFAIPYAGDNGNTVFFCATCGTYIWTEYLTGFWFVGVGILDDPKAFPPDVHIWTRSKQPWLDLPGDVPVFETKYDWEQLWSDDVKARLAAVIG